MDARAPFGDAYQDIRLRGPKTRMSFPMGVRSPGGGHRGSTLSPRTSEPRSTSSARNRKSTQPAARSRLDWSSAMGLDHFAATSLARDRRRGANKNTNNRTKSPALKSGLKSGCGCTVGKRNISRTKRIARSSAAAKLPRDAYGSTHVLDRIGCLGSSARVPWRRLVSKRRFFFGLRCVKRPQAAGVDERPIICHIWHELSAGLEI
jgi:hypothetical protein